MPDNPNEQPVPIQLAIQGGGAKLAALLAVMEAMQEAEKSAPGFPEGKVRVTRIAGTSAGAIAGALFAARIPIAQVRQALQAITAEERSRLFPSISNFSAAWSLMRNRPLWSSEHLRELLSKLLALNNCNVRTLKDIRDNRIELLIISSDLRNAQQHVFNQPTDNLVNALIESAAIPYFYRTWPNQDSVVLVDGGICQNLPSEELHERELEHPGGGAIVGITFEEMGINEAPRSFVSFSKALLETAMNSAILRAREHVKWPLWVRTKIGTFEFEEAFTRGLGDSYDLIRMKAADDIQQIVDDERQARQALTTTPPVEHRLKLELWKQTSEWMKSQLGEIYKNQHAKRLFKYLHASMVVQANCLAEEGVFSGLPDNVENRLMFAPEGEPIFCLLVGFDSSSAKDYKFIENPSWSIVDRHGVQANATPLPISSLTRGKREFLLFLSPPLPEDSDANAPYSLRVIDWVRDALGPLKEKGEDELALNGLRAAGVIARVELVLFLPSTFGAVFKAHDKSNAPGRLMTPEELLAYPPPAGFSALGWVGNDVPGGSGFAVRVVKSEKTVEASET